jgi:enoyl-CoA hydratase/carnithine racemase
VDHPPAGAAALGPRILEEGDVVAGRALLVAVEEVVDRGVVLVDGLLDQAQPEDPRVEVDVAGRVAGDRRDVMDSLELDEASVGGAVSEVVQRTVEDGVALLTLNRPDRLNAWTGEMERAYFGLLDECERTEDVRVIVVTGAGRGFCAGADMEELQAIGEGALDGAEAARDSRPQTFPLTIPKPIVAAINGPCAGIGLVQALMCDIRLAAAGAKLTTAFSRRGLVAEHGISWVLPRLVGPARALDLLLSGRVVLAEEAAELGLVNRALPGERLLEETLAYARELATNCAPSSMAAMKRQVYGDFERGLAEALEGANRLMADSLGAPDFVEGVSSFVERRPPDFAPLAKPRV